MGALYAGTGDLHWAFGGLAMAVAGVLLNAASR
jgi:hypothetical protein